MKKKSLLLILLSVCLALCVILTSSCDAVVVDDSESGIAATDSDSSAISGDSEEDSGIFVPEESGETKLYYIVSFDLNGGVGNIPSQSVENLKKAQEPSVQPTKEGYTFLGWYLGTEKWIFSSYLITEDTCLKAKWQEVEQEPDRYTVSFDSDGGSFVLAKQLAVGEAYSFTAPVRENYIFLGWYLGEEMILSSGVWNISSDVTLKARWQEVEQEPDKYTVSFDSDGGSFVLAKQLAVGEEYSFETPIRENYTFLGWYLGEEAIASSGVWNISSDVTLKAHWQEVEQEPDRYTVSFDLNGGEGNIPSQSVENLKKAQEPSVQPTKTGYTFLGWYLGTEKWIFSSYLITDDTCLKAHWQANDYTVAFNSNGGSEVSAVTVTYGEEYSFEAPTKENYVFLGWYLGEEAVASSGVWNMSSGATLTANWVIAQSEISFVTNNGETLDSLIVNYGENYILPQIEKQDYIFDGWYLGEVKWLDGTLLTQSITLTARWKGANEVFEYSEENGEVTITSFKGGVTEVVIPSTLGGAPVTNISADAFKNNTDITSVSFHGSFENYPAKLFEGCTSIEKLTLSGCYGEALYYLFGDDVSAVPASLTEIRFAKNSLYYDNATFKSQTSNHVITHVIDYEGANFQNCDYLQSVVIADGVTSIGDWAFAGCSGLTSVTIGNGVTSIRNYAFAFCYNLTSVVIPDSVTGIGSEAFCDCSSLTSVTIPDSVTSIGRNAFPDHLKAKQGGIYYVDTWVVGVVSNSITTATIKPGTKGIAGYAFEGCSSLTSVTIGNGVTSIRTRAFYGSSSLTKVYYIGTAAEWSNISIGSSNDNLINATRYYYSEEEPTESGNYWHYVGGVVTEW